MAELIKVDEALFAQLKKASTRPKRHHLQWLIEKFRASDEKIAEFKWDPGTYVKPSSAYATIHKAVKVNGAPIKVVFLNDHVYLIKEGTFDEQP